MLSEVKVRLPKLSAVAPSRLEERAGGCKSSAWLRHGRNGGARPGGQKKRPIGTTMDLQRRDRMVQPPRKGISGVTPRVSTGAVDSFDVIMGEKYKRNEVCRCRCRPSRVRGYHVVLGSVPS